MKYWLEIIRRQQDNINDIWLRLGIINYGWNKWHE